MLIEAIEKALKRSAHHPELLEVMNYAVLPAGKLFRPRLVEAIALDLCSKLSSDHLHLATATELHHAYTLVHDDLPSMDNDLIRRGKPSTHAQFGEWKAVLTGDALLISSFEEIGLITHPNFRKVHRLMIWSTGAKGLIEGQFRDLGVTEKVTFKDIVRIHELKTARLIQLVTLGSYLLTTNQNFKSQVEFLRLGREIGVSFQLLDDLSELSEEKVSSHEKSINPFINSHSEALKELKSSHLRLYSILSKHKLVNTQKMLSDYFQNNQRGLLRTFHQIEKNINGDLTQLKDWITNFV